MTARYPKKLPTMVSAPGGDITVKTVEAPVKVGEADAWGFWDEQTRTIGISSEITGRTLWKVFFHELTHVAITDSGLDELISNEMHEALCEAIAVARMRERFG